MIDFELILKLQDELLKYARWDEKELTDFGFCVCPNHAIIITAFENATNTTLTMIIDTEDVAIILSGLEQPSEFDLMMTIPNYKDDDYNGCYEGYNF